MDTLSTTDQKSYIMNLFGNVRPLLSSSEADTDDTVDTTREIVFQCIFYGLFLVMLGLFYYVFKKQEIKN